MFRIIKDLEVARALAEDGLLWWVGAEDGGENDTIITIPYGSEGVYRIHVDAGVIGVRLEE